jgi:phosphoribosylamine--glycine ligase
MLEGSKVFAKQLMRKHKIPTGFFQAFDSAEEARRYIHEVGAPVVVKADGLAAGKGVVICQSVPEALDTVTRMMEQQVFGDAGSRVVIEEYLTGEEASFLAFSDGETVLPMASSQDHKPILDGDLGPNTGGMGAYSPAPVISETVHQAVMDRIMIPTVRAMAAEGRPFRGVLYAGLMIRDGVPKVLEYNVRFGDPEAQPLLMRMEGDLVPVLEAVVDRRLQGVQLRWRQDPAVCVVMAAGGYPGPYQSGHPIEGLAEAEAAEGVVVFHAGTDRVGDRFVTKGGRVLGVTARDATIADAIARAYRGVRRIRWEGAYHRTDIGRKALDRLGRGA